MKWNVDRSSAEDKLLDILEWMKNAKEDIRHQVRNHIERQFFGR